MSQTQNNQTQPSSNSLGSLYPIHDSYFKFIFSKLENVKSFLQEFFPDLAKHIELESIEQNPTEKLSSTSKQKSYLDFVANCKIKNKAAKIYFLFEHKSKIDRLIILQLIRYILSVWEEDILNKKELTPIIPIIFYNGSKPWNIELDTITRFKEFPQEIKDQLLNFKYLLFDTNNLKDKDIQNKLNQNRMLMIALDIMRSKITNKDEDLIFDMLKELAKLIKEHKETYKEDIAIFIKMSIIYASHKAKLDPYKLKEKLLNSKEEEMVTVIDLIEQEAEERGIEKGVSKGQILGKLHKAQEMVLAAIEAKLDYVPSWIKEKILKVNDHAFLQGLLKQIVKTDDVEGLLKRSLA